MAARQDVAQHTTWRNDHDLLICPFVYNIRITNWDKVRILHRTQFGPQAVLDNERNIVNMGHPVDEQMLFFLLCHPSKSILKVTALSMIIQISHPKTPSYTRISQCVSIAIQEFSFEDSIREPIDL